MFSLSYRGSGGDLQAVLDNDQVCFSLPYRGSGGDLQAVLDNDQVYFLSPTEAAAETCRRCWTMTRCIFSLLQRQRRRPAGGAGQ